MGIFNCCFGERDKTPPPTRPNEKDSLIPKSEPSKGGTGYSAQSVLTVHSEQQRMSTTPVTSPPNTSGASSPNQSVRTVYPNQDNTTKTPPNTSSKKKDSVTPTRGNAKFEERKGVMGSPTVSDDF